MNNNEISDKTEDKYQHFVRPTTQRPPSIFNLTLWVVLVGLIAGFGGYLLANYFLPNNSTNYFNINNPNRDIKISIEQPLTNLGDNYQKSIAGVYKPLKSVPAIGQILFSENDFLGSAVVVTSDGWLMTSQQVTNNDQVSVVLGDMIYKVEDFVTDKFSGVVFLKIAENSLQPINFQLTDNLKIGEKLFSSADIPNSKKHSFTTTYLSNVHYSSNKYLFTDSIDYYIKISDINNKLASPYFNLDGNLIGLSYNVADKTLLLPAEYLKQAVKNLLNKTERPLLGIRYVDLENNSGFARKGALVYSAQYTAVIYNSPAYKAGIHSGDQIVAVNNDTISSYQTLTSILQNYRVGDQIVLKILRDNKEQDMAVTL